MIGTKIPATGEGGKSGRVHTLADYVVSPENTNKLEKCIAFGCDGFITDEFASQKVEMLALAESCKTSADPIEHYVISWQPGEIPTAQQAKEAVAIIKKEMGLDGLQVIWGFHADTGNCHIHLMVNRIDPVTERARRINNGFDVDALQMAVAKVEHVQGWNIEANKRFAVDENGEVAHVINTSDTKSIPKRIRDKELRHGEKSAVRVAQEMARPIIKDAKSWDDLHTRLAERGMRYEKKGSGAIFFVGDDAIKASDINRDCSLGSLQKRLGEYDAPVHDILIQKSPEPQPLNDVAKNLGFNEYHDARIVYRSNRDKAKEELEKQIKSDRDTLYKNQRDERKKRLSGDWRNRGAARNMVQRLMAVDQAQSKADLMDRHKAMRKVFASETPSVFPDFESWLKHGKGIDAADQYRFADHIAKTVGDSITPHTPHDDIRNYGHQIVGNDIYYSRHGTNETAFIDSGKEISFLDRSDDAVLAALQLSQQRFGKSLTLYGSDGFKSQALRLAVANNITIANPNLQQQIKDERYRQATERKEAMQSEIQKQFAVYQKAVGADYIRVGSRKQPTLEQEKQMDTLEVAAKVAKETFGATSPQGIEASKAFTEYKRATGPMFKYQDKQKGLGGDAGYPVDTMPWWQIHKDAQKNTEHLYYTPLSKTHHLILIDDTTPSMIEAMKAEGFEPAFIQKSSPKSWQCIVKIERMETTSEPGFAAKSDRKTDEYKASVRLAQELNKTYGDPELTNAIQPHRVPGTPNVKNKYRQSDGSFPTVEIVESSGIVSSRGQDRLREIMQELERENIKTEQVQKIVSSKEHEAGPSPVLDDMKVYQAFKKHIEKTVLKGPASDMSKLDYMIAVRLRGTGHDREAIAKIIASCSPRAGREHDWKDYALRTAETAFSFVGTRDIEKAGKYVEQWKKIEVKALSVPDGGDSGQSQGSNVNRGRNASTVPPREKGRGNDGGMAM